MGTEQAAGIMSTRDGQATAGRPQGLVGWLERLVKVEPEEAKALLASFAFFYCVLCSYYLLRPIRDEMGITIGKDNLQYYLTVILVVMLAAVPAFGWVVANVARRRIVPVVYSFLISNLVLFWLAYSNHGNQPPTWLAGVFFVWINVYVLFAVSLFWSFMSDTWTTAQAKRLYGFISVGGTAGAISGPLLLNALIARIGLANLLLLSATFLALALAAATVLRRLTGEGHGGAGAQEKADGKGLIAGATNVWNSPYLFRIALWVLAANLIGMYFYLEQNRLVSALITERNDRLVFFSRIDLATNILTIIVQALAVSRLIGVMGVGFTAAMTPAWCLIGIVLLAVAPALWSIALIVIVQRACAYGFANPSMRTLYTVVDAGDKYRAQNFIDTFVYRGGEAATGYIFNTLTKAAGVLASAGLAAVIAVAWIRLSFDLGRRQAALVPGKAEGGAAS